MPSNSVKLVGIDTVQRNLKITSAQAIKNASTKAKKIAAQMESTAKSQRKWTDQTGNARRSITGSSESKIGSIIIALAIGVEYGPPLELGMGGRYSIIKPTIAEYRKRYLNEFKGIL